MEILKKNIILALVLLFLSFSLYEIHFSFYHNITDILSGSLINLAIMPLEILLLTFFINRLLTQREKDSRLEKLNMVIGTFYSEAGRGLLTLFSSADPEIDVICNEMKINQKWVPKDFNGLRKKLKKHLYDIQINQIDLEELKRFLLEKRNFLLRLLENPNLLEHETFTDLLKSVFHLTEELTHRKNLKDVNPNDLRHLQADIRRAYLFLSAEWVDYMKYLKKHYPYLFSFAIRTNPFDLEARVEIEG